MVKILSFVYLMMIFGLPILAATLPCLIIDWLWLRIVILPFTPLIFAVTYILTAGVLSLPYQKAIKPGVFPLDLKDPVYGKRKLYGLCWTAVYYFTPVYFLVLAIPILKKLLFRLFGYRGQMDFTVYPDTWIRDLPILNFGKGAYLSNRATVGTNIVLNNGHILVDSVSVAEKGLLGHLSMLAPGASLGEFAEVGVGCAIGVQTRIADKAIIGPCSGLEHGITVGKGVKVGSGSHIGSGTNINEGLVLHFGSMIPRRAQLITQVDIEDYFSSRTVIPKNE